MSQAFLAFLIATLAFAAPANAVERRVALVIGNTDYAHTRTLPNARNDARAIAQLLRSMGFETTEAMDLGYRALREAIRTFGRAAAGAEVALLYYAGHGLEVAGENYLLPTDARLLSDADLEYEAVTLASLIDALRARRKLSLVILDACRNNPLADHIRLRAGVTRSVARGLARVESPSGDILVAYAAKAGTLAQDGTGANSPYAEALIKHLPTPGLDVRLVMGRVRDMVLEATAHSQEPYVYGSLGGAEVPLIAAPRQPIAPSLPVAGGATVSTAAEAWAWIKDTNDTAVLETFITRFADTFFADLAKSRLASVREERQRIALLQKQDDDRRRAEAAAAEAERKSDRDKPPRDPVAALIPGSGQSARDCPECPEMVVVPAGEYVMGSIDNDYEKPPHRIVISKPFAVGKFEVSFSEWEACTRNGGCRNHSPNDAGWGKGTLPVIRVSWDHAKSYVAWLSGRTGKTYRLLSESEWEYAARGGGSSSFWWGDASTSGMANFDKKRTLQVDTYRPNAFGLFNILGNVSEWVEDCYHDNYEGAPIDGRAWTTGGFCNWRVHRGGAWSTGAFRSAQRAWNKTSDIARDIGFRVAREL